MQDIESILKSIGLTEKEIRAYLVLLETGPQKANFLARRAGIERANIYYHLEGLKEKGLVSIYTEDTETTFFKAEPVKNIISILERQKAEMETTIAEAQFVIPKLEQIQKNSQTKYPKLRFFDKISAIENLYEEIISHETMEAIVNIERVDEFFPQYGLGFSKTIAKKNIRIRELVVPTKKAIEYKKSVNGVAHQVRLLSKSFKHKTDILIFGLNVAFISYGQAPTAFVIEDELITLAQREVFNGLWDR
ncbi:MAG: helix-turn-helix domain-containing protein [Candidatus Moraniibacteriota bacterium]